MRKPDWKIAVVGGSIAALGLGGFAAAQSGSGSSESDLPDGIRLQRDASASIQSVSSTVTVQPTTTTAAIADSTTTVASLATMNTVSASIESVPAVAPEPQPAPTLAPAPAPAPPADDSVDDSASVTSVASVDSVDSIDSSD